MRVCGCRPQARQIRATSAKLTGIPALVICSASSRADQCVIARSDGGGFSVDTTTAASSIRPGRPERGKSASAAIPPASYRARQAITVCRVIPTRRPISVFGRPSAASNTIRARCTWPAGAVDERVSSRRRAPSPGRSTNGAATDMPHCRPPTLSNHFGHAALGVPHHHDRHRHDMPFHALRSRELQAATGRVGGVRA